jgi:hypothetical protein
MKRKGGASKYEKGKFKEEFSKKGSKPKKPFKRSDRDDY